LKYFITAINNNISDSNLYYGFSLFELKKFKESIEFFDKFINTTENNENKIKALFYKGII
jgi:hypothetical protein